MKSKDPKIKRPIQYYMRALHRDIGFLVVGFVIVYAFSGIVLTYRTSDFFKIEKTVERTLKPGIPPSELSGAIHVRNLKIENVNDNIVNFEGGTYDMSTGKAEFKVRQTPAFLQRLNKLHVTSSRNPAHWVTVIFALALLFLAISSFWMYKTKSRFFRRGIVFSLAGIVIVLLLLFV
ncbi:MAG: PepSY domain-containing protein [Bacteroidales bacterium]|jgi:hypothetical protein|nr:PepSY domain-containing protein [Bacteroidales bacterium]